MTDLRTNGSQLNLLNWAARVGLVIGTAYLLTFCRGWMLAVISQPTPFDKALNYFVVLIAPVCALYSLGVNFSVSLVRRIWPVVLLMFWVSWCLFVFTPTQYWPDQTQIISVVLAVLLASQISRADLRLVRYGILGLAALFSLVVLIWARGLLGEALGGSVKQRLGADISAANVIFMPRVYYTLVFTCFATVVLERRLWLQLVGIATMGVPAVLGLGSGGRGPLVALVVAVLVFTVGSIRHIGKLRLTFISVGFAVLGYKSVTTLFPIIARRAAEDDTLRVAFYQDTLESIRQSLSVLGHGKGDEYAHNIFLEFMQDYGLIGFVLFLVFLYFILKEIWRVYRSTKDVEVLWAIGILFIQLTAQQFSLDIYVGALWAALVLPIGVGWWHEKMTAGISSRRPAPFRRVDSIDDRQMQDFGSGAREPLRTMQTPGRVG